jgi:hypothetical protein
MVSPINVFDMPGSVSFVPPSQIVCTLVPVIQEVWQERQFVSSEDTVQMFATRWVVGQMMVSRGSRLTW